MGGLGFRVGGHGVVNGRHKGFNHEPPLSMGRPRQVTTTTATASTPSAAPFVAFLALRQLELCSYYSDQDYEGDDAR